MLKHCGHYNYDKAKDDKWWDCIAAGYNAVLCWTIIRSTGHQINCTMQCNAWCRYALSCNLSLQSHGVPGGARRCLAVWSPAASEEPRSPPMRNGQLHNAGCRGIVILGSIYHGFSELISAAATRDQPYSGCMSTPPYLLVVRHFSSPSTPSVFLQEGWMPSVRWLI